MLVKWERGVVIGWRGGGKGEGICVFLGGGAGAWWIGGLGGCIEVGGKRGGGIDIGEWGMEELVVVRGWMDGWDLE